MVLFHNSIIKLDYNPATDILEVAYPDLHGYLLSEIKNSINTLVDTVRNYDVKKILLDSTNTIVAVSEEESREISSFLANGLVRTRTQKIARVQSASAVVESSAQKNINHIQASAVLPYQIQNFSNKTEAIAWLMNR